MKVDEPEPSLPRQETTLQEKQTQIQQPGSRKLPPQRCGKYSDTRKNQRQFNLNLTNKGSNNPEHQRHSKNHEERHCKPDTRKPDRIPSSGTSRINLHLDFQQKPRKTSTAFREQSTNILIKAQEADFPQAQSGILQVQYP
ncbi:hypothetical protein ACFYOC_18625 [Nocardiopsis alba]|uniref:hypothetical protein n=1 Tax=Nocardiopsis alba TaxID=53437 RepID=UPI00131B547C|nr:hypothetical protein [Nocardiopsis alba]